VDASTSRRRKTDLIHFLREVNILHLEAANRHLRDPPDGRGNRLRLASSVVNVRALREHSPGGAY